MASSMKDALTAAGIKIKEGRKKLTLDEAKALSHKEPPEEYSDIAMQRLPVEFKPLRTINKGEDFVRELVTILGKIVGSEKAAKVTIHTVYGLVELVHHHHERLSGSNRTSYKRLSARLLGIKKDILKKEPDNLVEFLFNKLRIPSLEEFMSSLPVSTSKVRREEFVEFLDREI